MINDLDKTMRVVPALCPLQRELRSISHNTVLVTGVDSADRNPILIID